MERKVVFRASAQADLTAILDYITDQAGPTIANSYIERIERACRALATFSERSTRYDDVVPGLRAIGFEGRATILFRVEAETVDVLMVAYGGRDWMTLLGGND